MKSQRPKILVITGVFPPTPIAEADHIARLSSELGARGFPVEILTTAVAGIPDTPNCRVHPVMPGWKWRDQSKLLSFARQMKPDIVLIWFVGPAFQFHPMITFAATELKAALPGVRIVTQITAPIGSLPKQFPLASRARLKVATFANGRSNVDYSFGTLLRDSDRVVAMAGPHLKRFAAALPGVETKSAVIPPPPLVVMSAADVASRKRGRNLLGVNETDPLFVYFGRLYRGKGLEVLISVFANVRAHTPNARLAIIGGPTVGRNDSWRVEDLYEQAKKCGVAEAISWSGEFAFDSDIGSTYLRAGDIAVLPFEEGAALNNSSLAACAGHGLPVITTEGEHPEPALVNEQNALVVPARDSTALAAAMNRLAGDRALQNRLRAGAEELALKYFTWDGSVASTIAVFEDVLGNRAVA